MSLKIGVIGVGVIGQDHIRRLTDTVTGARVVAVSDVDTGRAGSIAADVGATVFATGEELIASAEVDAVVVCSWGGSHEQYVLACIAAGKPVFCEKPLATTQEACLRITAAEQAAGVRLVQVGFMRRYDGQYRALRAALTSGAVGDASLFHCAHRISTVAPTFTTEMMINDAAIHEIDIVRWLFGEEITAVRAAIPHRDRRAAETLADPLMVYLETASGVLVDVEVSANMGSGYDIRGEIVGETGTVALGEASGIVARTAGEIRGPIATDWRARFAAAYDTEFIEWVAAISAGEAPTGPSSWDGYAATATADAAIAAIRSGHAEVVTLERMPDFYGALQLA